MTSVLPLKPHDDAAAQIEAWRGRCIRLFARAERLVGQSLEEAAHGGEAVKLRHLAGQRLADLAALMESREGTPKQVRARRSALLGWQAVESHRAFLAHGVETVLIDEQLSWYVLLDFTDYRGHSAEPKRWALSRQEAEHFEERVARCFADLARELGQLSKRTPA